MTNLTLTEAEAEATIYRTKGDLKMKTLTLTEAEKTELLILVRMELQHLDELGKYDQSNYEKWRQRRIKIMNSLHEKLLDEEV